MATWQSVGSFCWVDLVAHRMAEARQFYQDLFGWTSRDLDTGGGPPYAQFELDGQAVAGIGQMSDEMMHRGIAPVWNIYVAVGDAESTTEQAKMLDGEVVYPPTQVSEAGSLAFIRDPTGAMLGLWQAGQHAGAQVWGQPNSVSWVELATRNLDGAGQFYHDLFQWELEDYPHTPTAYRIIKNNGEMIGGILQMDDQWGEMPPHWSLYFNTSDIHALVDRLKQLGGNVHVAPFDTPVGPIALVADAQGGNFYLIQHQSSPAPAT